ncbi:MAG: hypothetical protein AAHH96_03500 [Candidatus Symbiodolus clandestinus]
MLKTDCYHNFIENYYGKKACVLTMDSFISPVFTKKDCQQLINEMVMNDAFEWTINGTTTSPINKFIQIDINNFKSLTNNFYFDSSEEKYINFSGHNCHQYSQKLQIKSSQFLYPIFRIHGIPSNGVNIFIFGGNYRKTPAGLHSDVCDVFLFPIVGHKKLFTWASDMLDKKNPKYINGKINARRLPTVDYSEHVNSSTLLEAQEGEAIYFPAGTWHINDYGKMTSTISIGISIFRNADVNMLIVPILKSQSFDDFFKHEDMNKVKLINYLIKEIKLNLLKKQSSYGFITYINKEINLTKITRGLQLVKETSFDIYSVKSDEYLYLISNGRIIRTLFNKNLTEFIHKINSVKKFTLDDTIIEYKDIIKWLLSTGILKFC